MLRLAMLGLIAFASGASAAPVKYDFGARSTPAALPTAVHGTYGNGCLAGGVALPITGPGEPPAWQAMRLSRNRNWGHPDMIAFIERLAPQAQAAGWPGLFVGDISQPRGGPMTSGHRSHQLGIDADIWMRPAARTVLSRQARESESSYSVVRRDQRGVTDQFTSSHFEVLRAAARDQAVARIFVNAAIKDSLCRDAAADDRDWLGKIRPWWGHDAHFHVRLHCPEGNAGCENQAPLPPGDGCDETLAWWFSDEALNPQPEPGAPAKPRAELTLADMPAACAFVLRAE